MSVQAFRFYKTAKLYISGTIALGSTACDLHLVKSTSNFATTTLSTYGSLTNEIASAAGYGLSGKAMTKTWASGVSAGVKRFNFTAISHVANAAAMTSILGFVVVARTGASAKAPANKLLGFASLTSAIFTVSSGNKLVINPSASGLFELT